MQFKIESTELCRCPRKTNICGDPDRPQNTTLLTSVLDVAVRHLEFVSGQVAEGVTLVEEIGRVGQHVGQGIVGGPPTRSELSLKERDGRRQVVCGVNKRLQT